MLENISYAGEVMTGRVVELHRKLVVLSLRNELHPLFHKQMEWLPIRTPSEMYERGERVQVMVVNREIMQQIDFRHWRMNDAPQGQLWLSRLPLVTNTASTLEEMYQEGDVVEVQVVDYVNWYIARVLLPSGLMIEMRTNDIHPGSSRDSQWRRKLMRGEKIEVVFRRASAYGSWVERYFERGLDHACDVVGYRTARISQARKGRVESGFIAARDAVRDEAGRLAYLKTTGGA
ncbi:MAG: hypothetical protein IPG34_07005 [Rhodocyclaceae bacterium]|nr:hypothetical protein [Rhodocyclaceae bacterium]